MPDTKEMTPVRMTLTAFQSLFDSAVGLVGCLQCGLVGRAGCGHLVKDFAPQQTITGVPAAGGGFTVAPRVTSMRISATTGLPLRRTAGD
jgi:hypothetical protein